MIKNIDKTYCRRNFSICEAPAYGFAIAMCNTKLYLYRDGIVRTVWEAEEEDFFWKSKKEAENFLSDFLGGQIEVETVETIIDGVKATLSKTSANMINKIVKEQKMSTVCG